MIILILHPGDLTIWELLEIGAFLLAMTVLPLAVIGFIIYRIIKARSRDADTISLKSKKDL